MKTIKFLVYTLAIALFSVSIISCSDSNEDPIETPDPISDEHFDVWVSIGGTSGMGSDNTQLVKSLESISEGTLSFNNNGADVTSKLRQETIIRGGYYYQISKDARFGKYEIVNDEIVVHAEFPFTTLKDRRHTHAWIDDKTLVLIGSNGPSSEILWIKVDTEKMAITAQGTLDLPAPPTGDTFSTSGIASYREDGKIIYTFLYSKQKTKFYAAFIDAKTMNVDKIVKEERAEFMAGTAYGELLQSKSFFDDKGDYYLACNNQIPNAPSTTQQYGTMVRIKKGETDFDKSYLGFQGGVEGAEYSRGKIITVEFLTSGKALLYIQDPTHTGAAGWSTDFNSYYAILDLNTDKLEDLGLSPSSGVFSQRSAVVGNKAYIGINPKTESPSVYVYDIPIKSLKKGLVIEEGYAFDRILFLKK